MATPCTSAHQSAHRHENLRSSLRGIPSLHLRRCLPILPLPLDTERLGSPTVAHPDMSISSTTSPSKDSTTFVLMPSLPLPSDSVSSDHSRDHNDDDVEQGLEENRTTAQCGNDRLLRTLGSHLNMLTAGTLYLLPSTLPFVASTFTAYASSSKTDSTSEGVVGLGEFTGISLLPCIGVLLPIAVFKIMTSLEKRSQSSLCHRRRSSIMTCPTINAIKRTWKTLKGDPPGYGPLALDASNTSSSSLYSDSDDDQECRGRRYKGVRLSSLPRPKTIIMTSLGLWTILMALSACLGLNSISNSVNTTNTASGALPPLPNEVRLGGFVTPEGQMSALTSVLDIDMNRDKIEEDEDDVAEDQVMEQDREEEPFAIIQSNIIILNQDSQVPAPKEGEVKDVDVSDQDVEDFMDVDALEALTLDPEDASVFQNFLSHLQADDEVIKAMREKGMTANDDLPCGYENPLQTESNLAHKLFGKVKGIARTYAPTPREKGRVFNYVAGWTELVILLSGMCMGGLLVGLGQARELHYQLLEQEDEDVRSRRQRRRHGLVASALIAGSALGLTMLMIFAESWDLPSLQFVGIGIAGMILAHAWIPNLPLQVESAEDVYMIEEDDRVEEKTTKRRNACSFDENQRWGLASCRA